MSDVTALAALPFPREPVILVYCLRLDAYASIVLCCLPVLGCEDSPASASYSETGTCASTCEKSVATACPNDTKTVATCTAECEAQIVKCTDASIVATYLDCVQSTPMTCGEFTGTASSPECVSPGLTYFACIAGKLPSTGSPDTASSGDATSVGGPMAPPTVGPATSGELVGVIRDGDQLTELKCVVGVEPAPVVTVNLGDSGEAMFYVSCATAKDFATDNRTITFAWMGTSAPGTLVLTKVVGFSVAVVDGGEGFQAAWSNNLPETTVVTVTLTDAVTKPGVLRGHVEATWERPGLITGGSSTVTVQRPGAMSANFDLPIP